MDYRTPVKQMNIYSRRYSNASTNSQRSQLSSLFPDNRHLSHVSKISETRYQHTPPHTETQISENSFESGFKNLGFSLKSIFPDSAYSETKTKTKKRHQRGLSQPPVCTNQGQVLQESNKNHLSPRDDGFKNIHNYLYGFDKQNKVKQISILPDENTYGAHRIHSHTRHASDADSVLYKEPDCKESLIEKMPITVSTYNPFFTEEKDLKSLGPVVCTTFCDMCKIETHTVLDFDEKDVPRTILQVVSNIFACCNTGPAWLNDRRVHKCFRCNNVVGVL